MALELWDGVNLLGIGLEIIGFIFLLSFLKNRFLQKKLTIKSKAEDKDVVNESTRWLDNKITLWELTIYLKRKLKDANVEKYEINDFVRHHSQDEPTQENWYVLLEDYYSLIAQKKFSYVEWIAIGLVIVGLCCQGLSIFLEKLILA